MHISWNWIKQRPHFIAEGLSKEYDIEVAERAEFKSHVGNDSTVIVRHLIRLPFERFKIISLINSILYKLQYRIMFEDVDIIWLTSPLLYRDIEPFCEGKKVIYDCMDDMIGIPKEETLKKLMARYEVDLYKRADILFVSSDYLKNKLFDRYGERNATLVNNAITDKITTYENKLPDSIGFNTHKFNITYIGAISHWFDFDSLVYALNNNPDFILNLFGPTEIDLPKHPQIVYHGQVPHENILGVMCHSDVLIMPFVVNEMIRSVNPVKLYEYIYSGKPCVASRYGETEKFEPYVSLYSDAHDLTRILENIYAGVTKQLALVECQRFSLQNTWVSRLNIIKPALEQLYK